MKESLKSKLNNLIQSQRGKVIPLNQIEVLCKQWGYKLSNAERRLRESPEIGKTYNQLHTAIIGYYWKSESEKAPITKIAQDFLNKWQPKKQEVVKDLFSIRE